MKSDSGNKTIKVLSIGSSQANFLLELYGGITRSFPGNFDFSINSLRKFSEDIRYSGEESINLIDLTKGHREAGISILRILNTALFRRNLLKSRISFKQEFRIRVFALGWSFELFKILVKILKERYYGNTVLKPIFDRYDVINVHLLFEENIMQSWYIPENKKIISSFWGSDLMRRSSLVNLYYVSSLLRISSVITCQSLEMREIALSKFGRDLVNKFRLAMFPLPIKLFEILEDSEYSDECKEQFINRYSIDANKINIVLGHNGSRYNNHIPIMNSLSSLGDKFLSRVNIIVPFTYNPDDASYKTEVQSFSENFRNFYLIDEYLSWENLAGLRKLTDIYIHMPASDAMSGSLTESLYVGSNVIVGGWLPYNYYERIGVPLIRINYFDELGSVIVRIDAKKKNNNRSILEKTLLGSSIYATWKNIYEE